MKPLPETLPLGLAYAPRDWEEIYESADDAIRAYVEREPGATIREALNEAPWPLVLVEYRREPKPSASVMLERFLEDWDEDFGHPERATEQTPEMLSAMQALLDSVPVNVFDVTGRLFQVTKEQAAKMLGVEL